MCRHRPSLPSSINGRAASLQHLPNEITLGQAFLENGIHIFVPSVIAPLLSLSSIRNRNWKDDHRSFSCTTKVVPQIAETHALRVYKTCREQVCPWVRARKEVVIQPCDVVAIDCYLRYPIYSFKQPYMRVRAD
jgi:hypothetical protein